MNIMTKEQIKKRKKCLWCQTTSKKLQLDCNDCENQEAKSFNELDVIKSLESDRDLRTHLIIFILILILVSCFS